MPPTGSQTGVRNANLTFQLASWAKKDGSGVCFDSSAGFALPNNARRSPDASWVRREKLDRLTDKRRALLPFVLISWWNLARPLTTLPNCATKMLEYMENGASLGWLIDPFDFRVYVHRPDQELVILENPDTVSGDSLLPGFNLNVLEPW